MKCAAAVMLRLRGRNVRRSRRSVNHTGPAGLKNETTYVVGVAFNRYAFVECPDQIGPGCGVTSCGDATHLPPRDRSHRRGPMMIPSAPPRIRYSSRFGRSSVNFATTLFRGSEASRSTYSTLRKLRKARVARATSAPAGLIAAGTRKTSTRPPTETFTAPAEDEGKDAR